ncbi:hypothetical protein MKZ38_006811 [Zalerion maritima]|uniref:Uncharacterized protein n=1 Tax=Zalerion maritima TaxID=339359 RepID=A0AAD5WUE6_9PEZI|nr:hypothetical protein MKZ38_006811 [Zalerion maritima]
MRLSEDGYDICQPWPTADRSSIKAWNIDSIELVDIGTVSRRNGEPSRGVVGFGVCSTAVVFRLWVYNRLPLTAITPSWRIDITEQAAAALFPQIEPCRAPSEALVFSFWGTCAVRFEPRLRQNRHFDRKDRHLAISSLVNSQSIRTSWALGGLGSSVVTEDCFFLVTPSSAAGASAHQGLSGNGTSARHQSLLFQ